MVFDNTIDIMLEFQVSLQQVMGPDGLHQQTSPQHEFFWSSFTDNILTHAPELQLVLAPGVLYLTHAAFMQLITMREFGFTRLHHLTGLGFWFAFIILLGLIPGAAATNSLPKIEIPELTAENYCTWVSLVNSIFTILGISYVLYLDIPAPVLNPQGAITNQADIDSFELESQKGLAYISLYVGKTLNHITQVFDNTIDIMLEFQVSLQHILGELVCSIQNSNTTKLYG